MEGDIIGSLKDLRYTGALTDEKLFAQSIASNEITKAFMELVVWLSAQIKDYCDLDETINDDQGTFTLDVSSFLREMDCPYSDIAGVDSLKVPQNRLFLLDYLTSELQACRMTGGFTKTEGNGESTHPIVQPITKIMKSLNCPPPSKNESVFKIFSTIEDKLKEVLSKLPRDHLGEPLLQKKLNADQWSKVAQINNVMCGEYKMRRQVLMKRVDVTIQSFLWADRLKSKSKEISEIFQPIRSKLKAESITCPADIIAARKDLCVIEKTNTGQAREVTQCDINKVLIGKVPDRGGRPSLQAPPPEMPKFQQRQPDSGRGGRGGGRGGYQGGRGGGGYQGGRGGNQGGGGGYQGGGGGYQGGGVSGGYDNRDRDNRDRGDRGGRGGRGGGWGGRGGRGGGGYNDRRGGGGGGGGGGKMYYS